MSRLSRRGKAPAMYVILYVSGVASDLLIYLLCRRLNFAVSLSSFIAWVGSTLLLYVANKIFTPTTRIKSFSAFLKEFVAYFGDRVFPGLFDIACMIIFADFVGTPEIPVKLAAYIAPLALKTLFDFVFIMTHSAKNTRGREAKTKR